VGVHIGHIGGRRQVNLTLPGQGNQFLECLSPHGGIKIIELFL
jgi:hypothetical protein